MSELIDQTISLPDLCLLMIFDLIPIRELLSTVNLVNHRWNSLLPAACARRRHPLILVQSKEAYEQSNGLDKHYPEPMNYVVQEDGKPLCDLKKLEFEYQNYAIECKKFSTNACERLTRLFPDLTSLQFIQPNGSISQIDQVNFMLSEWHASLVQFKLLFSIEMRSIFSYRVCEDQHESLFSSINSLTCLKELELDLITFKFSSCRVYVTLPIVSQLDMFKFTGSNFYEKNESSPSEVTFPFESLKVYGEPSMKPNQIFLDHAPTSLTVWMFDKFSPEYLNHFASFSNVLFNPISLGQFQEYKKFIKKFSMLKRVQLCISKLPIDQIAAAFTHLAHLEKLTLLVDTHKRTGKYDEIGQVEDEDKLPVLGSVKALDIYVHFGARHHLEWLHLHRVFPSVQVIELGLNEIFGKRCSCRKEIENDTRDDYLGCIQRYLLPLKMCTKLRKIVLKICFKDLDDESYSLTPQKLFAKFKI